MNLAHLRTIIWLRWRLTLNQIRKETWFSRVFSLVVLCLGGLSVVGSVSGILTAGYWVFPEQAPWWLPYVWDGVVVAFLVGWIWNVVTELQQRESLSMEKFLHLPVAPWNIVWLNYFASWFNLTLVFFVPSSMALSFVVAWRYGGWLWLTPVLAVAFFFMVTAITWQFRGWLSSLMSDPRRRSLLIALGTTLLIVVLMAPTALDRALTGTEQSPRQKLRHQRKELEANLSANNIDEAQFAERLAEIQAAEQKLWEERKQYLLNIVDQGNTYLPIGWLPQGVTSAQQGRPWVSAACIFGMLTLGTLSLYRAGTTSLRMHTQGGSTVARKQAAIPPITPTQLSNDSLNVSPTTSSAAHPMSASVVPATKTAANWVEWRWPFLTEHQAVIAAATFRSLARATEVKIAMFWPALVLTILLGTGSIFSKMGSSEWTSALAALGVVAFTAMGATQLIQNQFGFDRDGIRSFQLLPVEPKDILIGKNFAIMPAAIFLGCSALILWQIVRPLWWSHLLATGFQMLTSLLIFCLVGNLVSILTPLPLKPGSLQPARIDFKSAFLQVALFLLVPIGMVPALLPLGIEWLLHKYEIVQNIPIYLVGSAVYFVVIACSYRYLIAWEGDWLSKRLGIVARSVSRTE